MPATSVCVGVPTGIVSLHADATRVLSRDIVGLCVCTGLPGHGCCLIAFCALTGPSVALGSYIRLHSGSYIRGLFLQRKALRHAASCFEAPRTRVCRPLNVSLACTVSQPGSEHLWCQPSVAALRLGLWPQSVNDECMARLRLLGSLVYRGLGRSEAFVKSQAFRQENPCPFTIKVQQGQLTVQQLGNLMVEKVR